MKYLNNIKGIIVLIAAFLMLLVALMYVGNLANNRFNDIISSLVKENSRLSPTKGIERVRSLLGESELSVKAYTLTKDDEFMTRFYELVYETFDEIEAFKSDSLYYSQEVNTSIDTLESLAMRRINLFETILETGDEFRVERAMNKVSGAVSSLNEDLKTNASELPEEQKKKGVFKKKKESDVQSISETINAKSETVIHQFKQGLKSLSSRERKREAKLREVILLLSQDGEMLNSKVDSITALISEIELKQKEAEAERIANIAASSSSNVRFGVILSIALVLVFSTLLLLQIISTNKLSIAQKRASQEAIKLAQAKERFVANVSHELRTPLNSIIGFSELLDENKNASELKNFHSKIKSSAQHLAGLVNDLLDWSKIDAGKFELESIPFSPQELINEVKNMTLHLKADKDIEFIVRSEISSNFISGDPTRLKQVLINLLSNAFKFTEKGSVTLWVKEIPIEENRVRLDIKVVDTGIGIPEAKKKTIFEDFEQADSSVSRKFGGSGLGLAISKKLVNLQGGHIILESAEGRGSVFQVLIDYVKASGKKIEPKQSMQDLSHLSILIVDDTEVNRSLLISILRSSGCAIQEASSAKEALTLIEKNHFDFGLLDIKMPNINGIELAQKIKSSEYKNMRLIAVTAAPTEDIKSAGKKAGFEAVLSKPIEQQKLFEILNSVPLDSKEDNPLKPSAIKKSGQVIDRKMIESIFENDTAFRNEMLQAFVRTVEAEMKIIIGKDGIISADQLDDFAHKIMPSCRQIGAAQMLKTLDRFKGIELDKSDQDYFQKLVKEFELEFSAVNKVIQKIVSTS